MKVSIPAEELEALEDLASLELEELLLFPERSCDDRKNGINSNREVRRTGRLASDPIVSPGCPR